MKRILLAIILLGTSLNSFAQAVSSGGGTGDWNDPNSWTPNAVPDQTSGTITIQANHTITVTDARQADELTIAGTGTLVIASGGTLTIFDGSGTDLTVTIGDGFVTQNGTLNIQLGGTLINQGQIVSSSGNFNVFGDYQHNQNGGAIPTAKWEPGSEVIVNAITNSSLTGGLSQTFQDFTWDCSLQATPIILGGALTDINNNFTIRNTNNQILILSIADGGTANVDGNLSIENTSRFGIASAATYELNVFGDLLVSSSVDDALLLTSTGIVNLDVRGSFTKSGAGTVDFVSGSGTGTAILNLEGDFNFTSGTITKESPSGTATINLTGTTVQSYTGGGTFSQDVDFVIENFAIVDLGTSSLGGNGDFTLEGGGTMRVGATDANGALQTVTTAGNIRVDGTRTYNAGGNIIYNGANVQRLGDEWASPSGGLNGVAVNLEIDNLNGVENNISGIVTLVGIFRLTAGSFDIGASNTLIIQNEFEVTSGTIAGSSSSSLSFTNSGPLGALTMTSGSEQLLNLTVDRNETLVLNSELTIAATGALNLATGNLNFGGQTLMINGSMTPGLGGLMSNNTSNLVIGGTGAFGDVLFNGTNQLNNLTFGRTSGTYTWNAPVTINGTVDLAFGTLTHTSGLTMADGSTFSRSGGTISAAPAVGISDSYNVTYTGVSKNTGPELPTNATHLNNLTIDASGTISLQSAITINGDATLIGSTFSAGTNNITMNGANWNQTASFNPGSAEVTFAGNTSFVGTSTSFNDIMITGTLNAPNAFPLSIAGNFVNDGTFINGDGEVAFNGTTQVVRGTSVTPFNDITVAASTSVSVENRHDLFGNLVLNANSSFDADGPGGGIFTVKSTIAGDGAIAEIPATATLSGQLTVERYTLNNNADRNWRYVTASAAGNTATVSEWMDVSKGVTGATPITGTFNDPSNPGDWPSLTGIDQNAPSLFRMEEASAGVNTVDRWRSYPLDGTSSTAAALETGRGYALFVRQTSPIILSNRGTSVSGPVSVTVTRTGNTAADGYNVIGNPYPSAIDWDVVDDGLGPLSDFSSSVQLIDNVGNGGLSPGSVITYTDGVPNPTGANFNGIIPMGQAFLIRVNNVGSFSFQFDEGDKAAVGTSGTFLRKRRQINDIFRLALIKGNERNETVIRFLEEATDGLDAQYDAHKLKLEPFRIATLSSEPVDNKMVINTVSTFDCEKVIQVDTQYDSEGSYSLNLWELKTFTDDKEVYLTDKFLDSTFLVTDSIFYNFEVTSEAGTADSARFSLTFKYPDLVEDLSVTSTDPCNIDSLAFVIEDTQPGVFYQVNSGIDSLTADLGDGNTLTLTLKQEDLVEGVNNLTIQAIRSNCDTIQMPTILSFVKLPTPVITVEDDMLVSSVTENIQWLVGGEPIEGGTNAVYIPTETGEYAVEVDIDGCKVLSEAKVFAITSLEDLGVEDFKLFPNPVEDRLKVEIKGNTRPGLAVFITDLKGKTVYNGDMTSEELSIETSELVPGIYILSLKVEDLVYRSKFIKR